MNTRFFTHTHCDICGSNQTKIIFRFGVQHLVRCKGCGLHFLDKQRVDLARLYDENYYVKKEGNNANYADYQELGNEHIVRSNFNFAYRYIARHAREGTLLDIGAGFGDFIRYLPKTITADAIDASRWACKTMKSAGIHAHHGDFLHFKTQKKYQYITAFDVIEHQIHLTKCLLNIRSLLVDRGYVLLTTPDFGSIANRLLGKRAPTIQPLYHNYYFDRRWIARIFPLFGFRIVHMHTTYHTMISIRQALLLTSFAFPRLRTTTMVSLAHQSNLGSIVLPFLRLGGIQVIAQKESYPPYDY